MGDVKRSRDDSDDSSADESKKKKKHKDKKEKHKDKKEKHKKEKRHREDDAVAAGSVAPGVTPISEDDYFVKTAEYQLWLQEARKVYLDEIGSEEGRRLFKRFVSKWNGGELTPKYYSGVPKPEVRTRHVWGFASKLTHQDLSTLDSAKSSVNKATSASSGGGSSRPAGPAGLGGTRPGCGGGGSSSSNSRPAVGPMMPPPPPRPRP